MQERTSPRTRAGYSEAYAIATNPPYVRAGELDALEPEVRDWEPRAAIVDEGQTEALVRAARDVLRSGAPLVLEAHQDHADALARRLADAGYDGVRITRDLAGRDRVVEGTKP